MDWLNCLLRYTAPVVAVNREEALGELLSRAFDAWPSLSENRAPIEQQLARTTKAVETDELTSLRPDFVLAIALALELRPAFEVFERDFMPPLSGALVRAGLPADLVDDALQVVRFRLLVATESRPAKISSYRGRSSLSRWLYVVASREARALAGRARRRPTTDLELADRVAAKTGDLEAEFVAKNHRDVFSRALTTAIASLTSKERLLLRLDVLEGLNDGDIAKIFSVHRTTAMRWVAQATTKLSSEAKRLVASELALGRSELESLMRALASQFDISVGRLLAETPVPAASAQP